MNPFAFLLMLSAAEPAKCSYDRAAMLRLSENAFDQDFKGGWRALQNKGCLAEAADLIRDYRTATRRKHPDRLTWHEGQLRAFLNQTDAAIALFKQSHISPAQDGNGWNHYVDGTIAFLAGDRQRLEAARARLADVPKPKHPPVLKYEGKVVPLEWPPNLDVLDGLIKCFGRPYREAYESDACAVSGKIEA